MTHLVFWPWAALFFLGAWHGSNPAMGWLFAVALGMQKKSSAAVWQSLGPIAAGHFLSIGLVVAGAVLAGAVLPLRYLKIAAACILLGLGIRVLLGKSHPRWGGMQVGFRDLCIWSFLMASAHGAGFMLLPVLLKMSPGTPELGNSSAHFHAGGFAGPWTAAAALLVHTAGYLLITGLLAFLVYKQLGLEVLRKAWVNLDLLWATALIATAGLTLLIPV
ncbi:MAG: hypothetical protein ABSG16_10230 [Candidatus Acidiferrum sp.]|jgi:hypothetical protein